MAKRGTIMSTTLRARPADQKASIVAAVADSVWPLVDTGALRPVIYQELPMAQADEAHRIMAASTHIGKIVLYTRPMA
jgi:NADPH:quinone reductase-like Zn-dependent oxidoreductase